MEFIDHDETRTHKGVVRTLQPAEPFTFVTLEGLTGEDFLEKRILVYRKLDEDVLNTLVEITTKTSGELSEKVVEQTISGRDYSYSTEFTQDRINRIIGDRRFYPL